VSVVLLAVLLAAGGEVVRQAESLIDKGEFAAAQGLLEKALNVTPADIEARHLLGYVLYRQRKLEVARQHFLAVVKAAPSPHASRYFLGRIALASNRPREAITWLEPVAASGQIVLDTSSQLASALAQCGEPARAIPHLKAAIQQAPWDAPLYFRLGQAYKQTGQSALADDAFATSNRLRSAVREDVEALMATSQALAQGRSSDAAAAARRLTRPDADPNALVALGVLYGGAGRQSEALAVFEQAAARDGKFFQAQFNLGLALLKTGRAAQAVEPLDRAVALLPQSGEAWVTLGLAHVMNQRYDDAIPPLERAAKMDPTQPQLAPLLGTAYLRSGQPAKAVALLRGASATTAVVAPLLLLVEALSATGEAAAALEAAQEARRRFPTSAAAQMAAAQQLVREGRYQLARPVFEEALRLDPGLPEAELGLADTLQRAGSHEAAIRHYRAALAGRATELAARAGLARSLVAERRIDDARQILEEGVLAHPDDVPLRLELSRVYARLGKPDLAAEQTRRIEQLRATRQP
jgi:tetratricopeptide (TPR) repeat protein